MFHHFEFNEKHIFSNSSLAVALIFTKFLPDHLQTMPTKCYRIQVDLSNHFRKTRDQIFSNACEKRHKAVSPQHLIVLRPNLVHVITTMNWDYMQHFSAAPPSGQKIWKIAIFAYNVWKIWSKIKTIPYIPYSKHTHFWYHLVVKRFLRLYLCKALTYWH